MFDWLNILRILEMYSQFLKVPDISTMNVKALPCFQGIKEKRIHHSECSVIVKSHKYKDQPFLPAALTFFPPDSIIPKSIQLTKQIS